MSGGGMLGVTDLDSLEIVRGMVEHEFFGVADEYAKHIEAASLELVELRSRAILMPRIFGERHAYLEAQLEKATAIIRAAFREGEPWSDEAILFLKKNPV